MTHSVSQLSQTQKMAAYNTWANLQLCNWLSEADSVQWSMHIESSFTTLNTTVCHLWNAEHGWLSTLNKEAWSMAVERDSGLSQREVLNGFMETSRAFQVYVDQLTEESFHDTRNLGKDQKAVSLADIIQHVLNHATYHRGQLITMGRQAGLSSPPRTDYIFFMMQ